MPCVCSLDVGCVQRTTLAAVARVVCQLPSHDVFEVRSILFDRGHWLTDRKDNSMYSRAFITYYYYYLSLIPRHTAQWHPMLSFAFFHVLVFFGSHFCS